MKKLITSILALAMAAGLGVNALAAQVADTGNYDTENPNEATFTINAVATQLTATVPTTIYIDVDANTEATVGDATITNTSTGIIEVKAITLTSGDASAGGYTLTPYTDAATFSTYDVGSKKLGLQMTITGASVDGSKVYKTGTAAGDLQDGKALAMGVGDLKIAAKDSAAESTLQIASKALVSATGATAVDADSAAKMVITLGWYTGETA